MAPSKFWALQAALSPLDGPAQRFACGQGPGLLGWFCSVKTSEPGAEQFDMEALSLASGPGRLRAS